MPTIYHFDSKSETHFPQRSQLVDGRKSFLCIIYTDGSKTDERTGAGTYCKETETNISVSLGSITAFQSKIFDINESTEKLLRKHPDNKKIFI